MCLMASSKEYMRVIKEHVNEYVIEYGLKVNERMSMVGCISGEVGRRRRKMRYCYIGEV